MKIISKCIITGDEIGNAIIKTQNQFLKKCCNLIRFFWYQKIRTVFPNPD